MGELVDLLVNNGVAIVVVGYFLFKDYKTTKERIDTDIELSKVLQSLKDSVDVLRSIIDTDNDGK